MLWLIVVWNMRWAERIGRCEVEEIALSPTPSSDRNSQSESFRPTHALNNFTFSRWEPLFCTFTAVFLSLPVFPLSLTHMFYRFFLFVSLALKFLLVFNNGFLSISNFTVNYCSVWYEGARPPSASHNTPNCISVCHWKLL